MKMKSFMAFCAIMAGVLTAQGETSADVLVWYIDLDEAKWSTGKVFDEIDFWVASSDGNTLTRVSSLADSTYGMDETGGMGPRVSTTASSRISASPEDGKAGWYYTDLGSVGWSSGYGFMMELYNNGELVAWTDLSLHDTRDEAIPISRESIAASCFYSSGDLVDDMVPLSSLQAYNFGGQMVPEPSGGLLMLVGGALLALRRKRRA